MDIPLGGATSDKGDAITVFRKRSNAKASGTLMLPFRQFLVERVCTQVA